MLVTLIPSWFAAIMYTSCWANLILATPATENLHKSEQIAFCVIIFVLNVGNIHPVMAMSAEFVVSHLLYETRDAFDKFKGMIKIRNKSRNIEQSEQNSEASRLNVRSDVFMLR